jgi:glutathione S-transferase
VASQWSDAELAERMKKIPSKERQEAWLRAARKPYTDEERAAARSRLVQMLDKMEEMIGANGKGGQWLVGNAYSIADIAVVPFIKRIDEEIAPEAMQPAQHPKVAAWWAALQARPAFAKARIESFTSTLS